MYQFQLDAVLLTTMFAALEIARSPFESLRTNGSAPSGEITHPRCRPEQSEGFY